METDTDFNIIIDLFKFISQGTKSFLKDIVRAWLIINPRTRRHVIIGFAINLYFVVMASLLFTPPNFEQLSPLGVLNILLGFLSRFTLFSLGSLIFWSFLFTVAWGKRTFQQAMMEVAEEKNC